MKRVSTILLLILLVGIILQAIITKIIASHEIGDSTAWSRAIPKRYSQLLMLPDTSHNNNQAGVLFFRTSVFKYRSSVSCFFVKNKYYLQVYQLDSSWNHSLMHNLKEDFSSSLVALLTPYVEDSETEMKFKFRYVKPVKPINIFFSLYGDSTSIIKKNDTIAYYYAKCVNFSLRVGDATTDIFGESASTASSKTPIEILFLKRSNSLYLLLLSSIKANTVLDKNELYKLLFR
jgi:hypothetical protein